MSGFRNWRGNSASFCDPSALDFFIISHQYEDLGALR